MVSVAQLVAEPGLGLTGLHLPRPDAEVRWVATSELEDPSPFLEGGEVLLTTGLSTRGWRGQWNAYVDRLADVGVSSLAIGVGLTYRAAPASLIHACEQRGVNLIEVPRETSFVAVSRAAARLIQKRDEDEGRLALEFQRQLTSAAIRHDARRAVTARLAQLVDGCAMIIALDGRVEEGPVGPRPGLADIRSAQDDIAKIRAQGLRTASSFSDDLRSGLLVPVGLRGRPAHYLVVSVPGRLTNLRRTAITTAVALLGLTAEQERDRLETRRSLWGQMYNLLARGELDSAMVVGAAAAAPDLPARVQAVHAAGHAESLDDALAALERDGLLATIESEVLRTVASPAKALRSAEVLAERGLSVGVGESVRLSEVAMSISTARQALDRATPMAGVVHWVKLVREGAVSLLTPEVAASFSATFLSGLDQENVDMLASFLRHHGSRLKVADELGLHRNTVRNRLELIETAIGRSLNDPDTRAAAWLALQARQGQH